MKKIFIVIVASLVLILTGSIVFAQQNASAPFDVIAQITGDCTLGSSPIDVGPIVGSTSGSGIGSLDVTCTSGIPFTIDIDLGGNSAGCQRRMTDGSGAFLNYDICQDPSCVVLWHDGGNCGPNYTGTGGGPQSVTAYIQVPGGQNQPVGSYSDTVIATINW